MSQTGKYDNKISSLTSDLQELFNLQEARPLKSAISGQLEALTVLLNADAGYFYFTDTSSTERVSLKHSFPAVQHTDKIAQNILKSTLYDALTHLNSDEYFFINSRTLRKTRIPGKVFFNTLPKEGTCLFFRPSLRQVESGLLILVFGPGKACRKNINLVTVSKWFQVFTHVANHERFIEESESRYNFEKVLGNVSKQMIDTSTENIDEKINTGLKVITEFFKVDFGMLFQQIPGYPQAVMTHIHSRVGPTEAAKQMSIRADHFPFLTKEHLIRKKITYWNTMDDLPESAEVDRQSFMKWKTKSNLNIPLVLKNKTHAALCFSTLKNEIRWPKTIIRRASVIGEIFSNALARREADVSLQNSFKEIQQLKEQLESENTYLQKEIKLNHNFDDIIGHSPALKAVLLKVTQCAPTDATVMIFGETGTGKELIARAVHDQSLRKKRPLIKVDCGSLPATMIERELFGHEKGAFTGAHQQQKGRFELADGGTLFLDEVGELPLELQSKLLRVLQDGQFERLGDPRTRNIDIRVIAATNRDLEREIEKGRFRSDLWYRLNVFPITVPPLRDRWEDIPDLVNWFVNKHGKKMGRQISKIPEEVMKNFTGRRWDGNVRELENTVQRSVIVSTGPILVNADQPDTSKAPPPFPPSDNTLETMEREHISRILKKTNGRIYGDKGAACILGLNPSTLRFRMKKLGIKKNQI